MPRILSALLAAAVLLFAAAPARAGAGIPMVPDTRLNDIAMATVDGCGNPVIIYNPMVAQAAGPDASRFFLAHEEAHHALGHVQASAYAGAWLHQGMELEADCAAARTLAANDDMAAVWAAADALGRQGGMSNDMLHPPGAVRAQRVLACAQGW